MKSIPLILILAGLAFAQNAPPGGRDFTELLALQPIVKPSSFDCSADGTVLNSLTGEPIARAHVNMISSGSTYSAVTDNSGRWALSSVACASGQLQVTRPGFLQGAAGAGRPLTLVSGSPVHDLKTELMPQSVASGKVLDDQGDPVMNAQVTALASRVVEGKPRFLGAGSGATNDLGEYRIANLPHGKYILCVHLNQPNATNSPTMTADSCAPGPLEGGAASAMDLPAGREAKIDFTLNQVVPIHVRGTVSGLPEGRGVGVNLVKRGVNADYSGNISSGVRDGKFDFRVPPGSYTLTADYFEAGKRLSARVPVDAGSSDIDNVVVHLDSGFTVTGIVRVESGSGRPAPPFAVNLRPADPSSGLGQWKWEADHTAFAINDMTPDSFRLNATPPPPFYVKSATLAGQDILNSEIPISQSAGPIEIVLGDDGGSLEGDVVNANGQPVAAGIMLLRNTTRVAGLTSQPNGHFKLRNIAPGDYTIYAWDVPDEVQYANPDWMNRNAGGGASVTVTAGQNTQIKLTEQQVPPE